MPPFPTMNARLFLSLIPLLLAACDIPGMGPDPRIAQREADGKAIGAACRHALRGIEDCYILNEKALKTAVFEGWKEMDQYMRENKMEGIPSKETKPRPEEEVIVEEKKSIPAAKDKPGSGSKSKGEAAATQGKPTDKPATKAASH